MRSANDVRAPVGGATGRSTTRRHARLTLRLPGTWVQLDPHRPVLTSKRIRSFVDVAMGRADELAHARHEMRKALGLVIDNAPPDAMLESTFLCHEISPGSPTPIAVSVFTPVQIRMSPAVGCAPAAVIETFLETMDILGGADAWSRIGCVDGEAARRWHVTENVITDGYSDPPLRSFVADYWRTVPGSKSLVLVTVTSPLADIPHTLLELADAIVGGSRFMSNPRFATGRAPSEGPQ